MTDTSKSAVANGSDHPMKIEPTSARVVVPVHGRQIADTTYALRFTETDCIPVLYIPRAADHALHLTVGPDVNCTLREWSCSFHNLVCTLSKIESCPGSGGRRSRCPSRPPTDTHQGTAK